jgi:PAS domain-containing protein
MKLRRDFGALKVAPGGGEDLGRLIFHGIPCPMWIFEKQTLRFLAVNDAGVKLSGWRQEEFRRIKQTIISQERQPTRN